MIFTVMKKIEPCPHFKEQRAGPVKGQLELGNVTVECIWDVLEMIKTLVL